MNLGSVQQQYSLSHFISVDKASCEYTGVIKFNAPNANLPFPDAAQCALGPPPPDTKAPPSYKFSKDFYKATGFDHLGLDWQPCGHPDPNKFGKPHFDFHLYRITSAQRDLMSCDILQGAPICDFPGAPLPGGQTQTTYAGKKFFAVGKVTAGSDADKIANMPELFTVDLGSAVPHSGIHVYDIDGAVDVVDWTDPVLIIGSYDSQVVNWEPMFPYSFVSGYTRNEFVEETITYVQQTISLPASYSVVYDSTSNFTTVTIKGPAVNCVVGGKSGKTKTNKFN